MEEMDQESHRGGGITRPESGHLQWIGQSGFTLEQDWTVVPSWNVRWGNAVDSPRIIIEPVWPLHCWVIAHDDDGKETLCERHPNASTAIRRAIELLRPAELGTAAVEAALAGLANLDEPFSAS